MILCGHTCVFPAHCPPPPHRATAYAIYSFFKLMEQYLMDIKAVGAVAVDGVGASREVAAYLSGTCGWVAALQLDAHGALRLKDESKTAQKHMFPFCCIPARKLSG